MIWPMSSMPVIGRSIDGGDQVADLQSRFRGRSTGVGSCDADALAFVLAIVAEDSQVARRLRRRFSASSAGVDRRPAVQGGLLAQLLFDAIEPPAGPTRPRPDIGWRIRCR